MKKLILFLIGIIFSLQSFSQYDDPDIIRKTISTSTGIVKQLEIRQKKASNIIYTGIAITGVGIVVTGFGVSKYITESEKIKDGDVYSGQIPAILDNQMQMNKTIPAALLASSGIVLAATGATIIVKGVMKKNDVEFALKTYGQTGAGMGVTITF